MKLTPEIIEYIDRSVLCWLATVSDQNIPNVSPKECFTYFAEDSIIVANIASPQTVRNIKQNPNVCISFIEVLVQKGFQIHGVAEIVDSSHADFEAMAASLHQMTEGLFPFKTITKITLKNAKPIIAPRYVLFPGTTEADQIESAKELYGIQG